MSSTEGRRALITGITGQDGSYMAEWLLSKKYDVFGVVRRLSRPNLQNIQGILPRLHLIDADLADQSSLDAAVKIADPHEVYNFGAQSFVGTSFVQPELTSNIDGLGALRLLEATRRYASDARFYQASSSEMFGKSGFPIQNEDTPFHPRSPYGIAKVFAHHATVHYREAYGLRAVSGIAFNHESPRRGSEFVTRVITKGVTRIKCGLERRLRIGNFNARRDWGYAPEYVQGFWLSLQRPEADDYVFATGETHSVGEFVVAAFQAAGISADCGYDVYLESNPAAMRPSDVEYLCGDATKAKRILGWTPKVHFNELVRLMMAEEVP